MRPRSKQRDGLTLIEILIVVSIFAILLGLLLGSLQRVREQAVLTQNKNNIRQIVLGLHQLSDVKEGNVSDLARSSMQGVTFAKADASLFHRLIPFVYGPTGTFSPNMTVEEANNWAFPNVPVYRNPADPSWDLYPGLVQLRGKCSYACNMIAMDGSIRMVASLPDGSSQTIAFGDKYYASDPLSSLGIGQTINDYSHVFDPWNAEYYGSRRATFADQGWHDVVPVTDSTSRTTQASLPGKTFQVRPRQLDVDPRILQSPFSSGLTVGMFDGSVRTLSPSTAEPIFWALVTPSGGEAIPNN